jgi:hypothetical protein
MVAATARGAQSSSNIPMKARLTNLVMHINLSAPIHTISQSIGGTGVSPVQAQA